MRAMSWKTAMVCVLMAGIAQAVPVRFLFSPSDFLNLYSTDTSLSRGEQENPRLVVDAREYPVSPAPPPAPFAGTYQILNQPSALNSYENWLEGLGEGEGIFAFEMWVTTPGVSNNPYDGNPANPWNQEIYRDGSLGNSAAGISATAAAGWSTEVIDMWGGNYGVRWYTTDQFLFLRPGADLGLFSFTMEDTNAQIGESYRVWFGSPDLVFDAEGWGARTPSYVPFADGMEDNNARWNGVVSARATSVPDAGTTIVLLGAALAGLNTLKRRLG